LRTVAAQFRMSAASLIELFNFGQKRVRAFRFGKTPLFVSRYPHQTGGAGKNSFEAKSPRL